MSNAPYLFKDSEGGVARIHMTPEQYAGLTDRNYKIFMPKAEDRLTTKVNLYPYSSIDELIASINGSE